MAFFSKKDGAGKKTEKKGKAPALRSRQAFQGGSYSLAVSALVLAIVVVLNIFVSALPLSMTHYDISASKLYSITSNTKVVVNALDKDVTIYWIVQADQEDEVIANLLDKYESLSDHIRVVKRNPDVYPTFAQQYTDEDVANNSLVVECGDRNRYIAYDDIYIQKPDMYSYTYNSSFDGEGAITSAIDYVVNAELPKLYVLEGHGEAELPANFRDQVEKENVEIDSLSLLTTDSIPVEAACLMIWAPESDISEEEKNMLQDYTQDGGRLLVVAGPGQEGNLENLNSLLTEYGVKFADGLVIEGDRGYFASQNPLLLLPELNSADVTDALIEENYHVMLPAAQGLDLSEAQDSVSALLTTSEASYAKADGYEITTYEKEDGDAEGPFAVGVSVDCGNDGRIIWFTSSFFLEDEYNAYSSGANGDLTMNAIASMVGETEAMAIRSKSLNYNYLTISESASAWLKVLMIGVFPLAYLGIGIAVVLRRRRLQHEAVR